MFGLVGELKRQEVSPGRWALSPPPRCSVLGELKTDRQLPEALGWRFPQGHSGVSHIKGGEWLPSGVHTELTGVLTGHRAPSLWQVSALT